MHQKIGRQAMDAWRRTILGVSAAVLCLAVVGATTEQTLPQPVFVDLIKNKQRCIGRPA